MYQQSKTRLWLMRLCLGWTILLLSASPSFAQVTGSPSMWLNCSSHQVIYDGNAQTGGAAPSDTKLYRCRTTVLVQSNSGSLVRTGYTFAGWNTQANGNGTNYAAGTGNFKMGSANVTLYAKWAVNSYTVSYDGNTSTSGSVPSSGNYDYAATVTVVGNTGALVKTGYTFAGWNTLANGGGTSYAPNATFTMGTGNLTLYAQWTANSYTVTYNGNGSDGGSLPAASGYTYGQSYTFAAAGVTRTGYTFAGWNDAPAGTGTNYAAGVASVLSQTSFTVYAKWTANSYTITYNGNGSDGGTLPTAANYIYGQSYTFAAAAVTRTGFTFAGWNDAAAGTGTNYTSGAGSVLSRVSFTVYAKWTANSYTITYNGNGSDGGTLPAAGSYTYGQSYNFAAAGVTRTGYTFAGWNDAADGTGTNYTAGVGSVLNQTSFTVYAKWTANSYTITYNGNGSDGGTLPTAASYTYGQSFTFAAAGVTRTGYTFAGWNDAAAGTGTNYPAGVGSVLSRTSFTVYAKWTVNSYVVTYNDNGSTNGTVPAAANYNFGATVNVASNTGALTKTGLYLVAWNTAADGTGTSYALGTGTFTMGSSNLTLYARWWTDLCPTLAGGTWVGVPGNTNHGTSDFCVMKYMATNVASKPYSQAGVGPWNGYEGVTATTAKTYCSSLGSGYHLITNPEWMTIATNIAAQTNNWSGGSLGSGSLAVGNSGSGSGSNMGICPADADDNKAWLGASCTDRQTQGANAFIKRRTHTLSNNQVVWDMSGNAWQVVDYANASDKPAPTGESWNELSAMTGSTTSPTSHLVPRASTEGWWNNSWNSTQGVGKFNPGAQGGGGQMLRGSDFSYPSSIAGIFAGWMSHAPTSGTFHAYGAQYTYPTFRCTYKPGSLVVTYNGNGHTSGTAPSDSLLYNAGEPVLTATNTGTLAKTDHTFAGWNTAADGSGTSYAANTTFTMDSSSLTLYAKWTANSYTVTYNGNGSDGGSLPAAASYTYGQSYTFAAAGVTRTGYTFMGWNTALDGTGTNYAAGGASVLSQASFTVYAKWAINTYTVTYDGNNQTSGTTPSAGSYTYNATITVAGNTGNLMKTGYTFAGWNTSAGGGGTSYVAGTGTFTMGSSDTILYAHYLPMMSPPLTVTNYSATSLAIAWPSVSTAAGYLLVRHTADPSFVPTNGAAYSPGAQAGGTVVSVGTALSYRDTGLTTGNTYYYKIYAYDSGYSYSSATSASKVAAPVTLTMNPGATSWTVPDGVTFLTIEIWGGGGGGNYAPYDAGGGGGGGGGAASKTLVVTPGQTINYAVGSAAHEGQTGGTTSCAGMLAYGGGPGTGSTSNSAPGVGGAGGTASGGSSNWTGSNGGTGIVATYGSGGAGGAAGGNGGAGGAGGIWEGPAGVGATPGGGGGGGRRWGAGAGGGSGMVRITY